MAQLTMEMKTKIVAMRNYTTLTFDEIAVECGCSVSIYNAIFIKKTKS